MRSVIDILRNDDIIMESLTDMMMAQEGVGKFRYVETALEAIATPAGQAEMMNRLFKQAQKIESVDFGKIPDSKGDITRYVYYRQLADTIETLNKLAEGNETPNITAMNKIHSILLTNRDDFVFGFKTDNWLIINVYKCAVLTLYDLSNVCIVDVTDHLRDKLSMKLNKQTAKELRSVTKNANHMIKLFERGDWSTIMKACRAGLKISMEAALAAYDNDEIATEDININLNYTGADPSSRVDNIVNPIHQVFTAAKDLPGKVLGTIASVPKFIGDVWKSGAFGKGGIIVAAVIGAMLFIRTAVALFMKGAAKINEIIKNNIEVLKVNIANNNEGSDSVEAQKKMLAKLEGLSDKIEYSILKSERAAKEEIAKSDRETFPVDDFRNFSGSDFDF